MKLPKIYTLLVASSICLPIALYLVSGRLRPLLLKEDHLIENLTALLFFAGGFTGIFFLIRPAYRKLQKYLIVLPCVAFLGFLDEIGFGYRQFEMPVLELLGVEMDGIHDLVDVAAIATLRMLRGRKFEVLMIGLALLAVIVLLQKKWLPVARRVLSLQKIKSWFHPFSPLRFLALAIVYFCIASVIDVGMSLYSNLESNFLALIEEILEMNVALAMLFANVTIRYQRSHSTNTKQDLPLKQLTR